MQFRRVEVSEKDFDPACWPADGTDAQPVAIPTERTTPEKAVPLDGNAPSQGSASAGEAQAPAKQAAMIAIRPFMMLAI